MAGPASATGTLALAQRSPGLRRP